MKSERQELSLLCFLRAVGSMYGILVFHAYIVQILLWKLLFLFELHLFCLIKIIMNIFKWLVVLPGGYLKNKLSCDDLFIFYFGRWMCVTLVSDFEKCLRAPVSQLRQWRLKAVCTFLAVCHFTALSRALLPQLNLFLSCVPLFFYVHPRLQLPFGFWWLEKVNEVHRVLDYRLYVEETDHL